MQYFSFDGIDRMKRVKVSTKNLLNYRYNNSTLLSSAKTTIDDNDDFENSYSYNTFNELVEIAQVGINPTTLISATKNVSYEYNQEIQRTKASRFENLISVFDTNYVYDEIGRLNQIEHKNLSETFANYSMIY
ncbi:MAG: hypothetical protein LBB88_00410, partial [Planctomycetaceae bacterium]|nr:hypothetical protein [Planctomycetaceae bacterium]